MRDKITWQQLQVSVKRLPDVIKTHWPPKSDRAKWQPYLTYLLGLIGWIFLALNYPFESLLPTYAGF